jgi:transcriptional regulator with GAF, ATPase, and Fis domain/tetratricopeptide (TPR) repeat protein
MSVLTQPEAQILEIEELNSQAWSLNRENSEKAVELANLALTKSTAINYPLGIALAKKTLGVCYIWSSRNEEGVNYCLEANVIFKSLKDKLNGAHVYINLGTNFYFLSDYDTAIKCYQISYDLNAKIKYEPGMADALNGMGTVHYTLGKNDKALSSLLESESLCKKNNYTTSLVNVQEGLGEAYYNLKQYDKALVFFENCISLSKELGAYTTEAYALDGLGKTYTALKEYDKALDYYNKSLKIRKKISFKYGEATTLKNIGTLYIDKKDTKKAIKYLLSAFELATDIASKESAYQSSEKLAELYESENETAEALKYYKIFHEAKEAVKNLKSEQLAKSFELQHKVLQSQAEKAIIEERGKEQESFSESLTLMSHIGQQIISSLSVETIVNTVYESVNGLMDATGFGIGLYQKTDNTIVYPLYIEGEEKFENIVYELDDNNRLTVLCYNTSKEIIINNFEKEIGKYIKEKDTAPKAGRHVESLIYLPLKYKDTTLGVITVQSFSLNAYSNYHVNILKNLAAYTAIALENANLYHEQEQKVKERTLELVKSKEEVEKSYQINKKINEIGRHITSNLNLGKIFKELYESINEIMSVECFGVRIYKQDSQTVEYKFEMERGELSDEVHIIPLTDDDNYTVWTIKNRKDIFLNDNKKEYKKYVKQIKVVSGDMPNSLMFTPMMAAEKLIGVITVQSFQFNAYQPYHLDVLKTLATYTAIALENAYLYENMEVKVNERTMEVVKQKEEIEKTFENTRIVSEIGQEISSTFSIQEIIYKVYNRINKLMDAATFGIGIFDPETQQINFSGAIEGGKILDDYCYKLSDSERPAILCYTNQKDIVIHNFTEEFVKSKKIEHRHSLPGQNTDSIIYIPLTQNNKRIGVITVQSFKANAYNDYHLQLLKNLSIYAAIALDNASLYTQMEDRVKERTVEITTAYQNTKLLSEVAEEISASLSVSTITAKVYENVSKFMKADCFGIGILNKQGDMLEFNGFVENDVVMNDFVFKISDSERLAVQCFLGDKEILIDDYAVEYSKYFKGRHAPVAGKESTSIIYLPIYSKGKVIGVITVQSFEKNAYSDYQFNILKNLAISIGIALDNANLYSNLEEKVNERTLEVIRQKEQIEKSFEDTRTLSKLGNEITSILSIEGIIDKVYSKITSLMDAVCFGVGLFNKETGKIIYPLFIEGEDKFSSMVYDSTERDKLTYLCYNENRDIVINNFNEEIESYVGKVKTQMAGGIDTQSVIYLPMVVKEKVMGVITVQSQKSNAYTDYHVQILKNLTVYVAIGIDNAFLYQNMEDMVGERTKEVTKQKELLEKNFNDIKISAQIAKDIASSLSVETIAAKVYDNVKSVLNAESFGIGIYNADTNSLQFQGFIEKGEKLPQFEISLEQSERYAVMSFTKEIEVIINDHHKEYIKYTKVLASSVVGDFPESLVYLPLYTKEKKIGVLTAQSFSKNAFQEYQVNFLKNMALSIAIALDNANLYENLEQKVQERTGEVQKQKAIIEEKNKDITDSIKYAKKIQQAIAPNIDDFNKNFVDSFILYKPKDIVSGDFYWFEHFGDNTVFAAADCTGHGVPGAFMSLICSDIMYKVITEQKIHDPAKALTSIDEKLVKLIKKSSEASANDGMDIALCTYEKRYKILSYAGAHRPLILIRDKQIIEYRPNKFSIGGHSTEGKNFVMTEIKLKTNDIVYLLTDGYVDQFGGDNGKKFKFKSFKELVVSISDKPMKEQKQIIDETFEQWRGSLEQIDDVCVIGVKV